MFAIDVINQVISLENVQMVTEVVAAVVEDSAAVDEVHSEVAIRMVVVAAIHSEEAEEVMAVVHSIDQAIVVIDAINQAI